MKHKLIDDLEKIYSYYDYICKKCGRNCMECKLCFLNSTNYSYYFLCDIVSELIITMDKYYVEGQ